MLDTAALDDNGDWLVRAVKDPEVEALKEVAHALSRVISPVVVLPPDSSQMNFIGEAARRWDLNIDLFVRQLVEYVIFFMQPHSWEELEYDNNKYAFATAHNTMVIMKILRWTLRMSNAYTQLRRYRLECWQPSHCAICDIGYWIPHNQEGTTAELSAHSSFIDDA